MLAVRASEAPIGTALRSALSMGLPLVVLVLMARPEDAAFAAFGAFGGLYASSLPYRRRARVLVGVGACFVAAVAAGSGLSFLVYDGHSAAWVSTLAVVAGLAKWGCDAAGTGSPGPWMFLFAFAASTQLSAGPAEVLARTAFAAVGAGVAWLVVMSGVLTDRDGPETRAVAVAVRASERVLALGEDANPRDWHQAHTALVRAEELTRDLAGDTGATLRRSVARAEDRLTDAVLSGLAPPRAPASGPPDAAGPASRAEVTVVELQRLRARNARHTAALRVLTAGRAVLGVGVAGMLSLQLHLGHPYWAPVSAAAVLQATHVRMTWHRGVQRALGTAGGLALAAVLLEMHPGPWAIALLVVLMQLGIELLIVRNYALGVLFITPLTMLMSELLRAGPAYAVLVDRLAGVALGIVVGVIAALLVVHPRAAASLRDAVDRCRAATTWAMTAAAPDAVAATEELRDALLQLRVAEDVARGEPWRTAVTRLEVAAVEQRAYLALAASRRRLRALALPA